MKTCKARDIPEASAVAPALVIAFVLLWLAWLLIQSHLAPTRSTILVVVFDGTTTSIPPWSAPAPSSPCS